MDYTASLEIILCANGKSMLLSIKFAIMSMNFHLSKLLEQKSNIRNISQGEIIHDCKLRKDTKICAYVFLAE